MSPYRNTTKRSSNASVPTEETARTPVQCPFCGRALAVWATPEAIAHGLWIKCKNPACRREIEIKL